MTQRERLAAAVAHRLADRTPTSIFARPELLRSLAGRMKASSADDVIRRLGADLYLDVQPTVRSPDFERRANGVLHGDHSYAGQKMIFHDERTFEDLWGVVRRVGEDGRRKENDQKSNGNGLHGPPPKRSLLVLNHNSP